MPIYEYVPNSGECDSCGGRFAILQKLSEPELKVCETCGQACKKVVSLFSIGTESAVQKKVVTAEAKKAARIGPSSADTPEKKSAHLHNCASLGCFAKP